MKLTKLYTINEGKFPITQDMKDVASYIASEAMKIDENSETTQTITIGKTEEQPYKEYTTKIDGGKYGTEEIDIIIAKDNQSQRKRYAYTYYSKAKIKTIIVYAKSESTYNEYYYSILHELIHIFDPKLNNPEIRKRLKEKYFDKQQNKTPQEFYKYINSPHELDAFISTITDELIEYLKTPQNTATFIKNINTNTKTLPKQFNALKYIIQKPTSRKRFIKALYKSYNELIETENQHNW